jgi:hypothetical protein
MYKRLILLLLWPVAILVFLSSGCRGKTSGEHLGQPGLAPGVTGTPLTPSPRASETRPSLLTEATPSVPAGCTAISPKPTPGPTEASLFPPVSPEEWIMGPQEASITFVEYGDFQ